MKKALMFLIIISAVFFSGTFAFAEDSDTTPDLTHSTMIGTSDGGAMVLYGHTLTKYDSDFGVVKTVDVRESAKRSKDALPSGSDMVMHAHHEWKKVTDDSTNSAQVAKTSVEPTSDLQSSSTQ